SRRTSATSSHAVGSISSWATPPGSGASGWRRRSGKRSPRATRRGVPSHRGFAHLPDLAVAFVERALELAAPGGVAALLVPAKLASCGYAEPLRQLLAHGTRIERAAPVEGAAAAFGAA